MIHADLRHHGLSTCRAFSPQIVTYGEPIDFKTCQSTVPIDIDESCLSAASLDLIETFKYRFPDMDPQTIFRVVQKASDMFRDSYSRSDSPTPSDSSLSTVPDSESTPATHGYNSFDYIGISFILGIRAENRRRRAPGNDC